MQVEGFRADDDEAARHEFFGKVLPVIKGEREAEPGFVFFQGDPVYVLITDWLEYRGLPLTRSVLGAETTPPAESGAVDVLIQQHTGSMVELHESMLTSVEAMLERSGVIQHFRARLLLIRFTQLLRVSRAKGDRQVARSTTFDTVCSLVDGWLENARLVQAREMLRKEVKHEYGLDIVAAEVDLEIVLQRHVDSTGRRPDYLEEIV